MIVFKKKSNENSNTVQFLKTIKYIFLIERLFVIDQAIREI